MDITNSFGLVADKEAQNAQFTQIAEDLARAAVGAATKALYGSETQIMFIDPQTGESLEIPVNPPEITLKWERHTETVNILNLGEVDFTTGKKLQGISFSSFFPVEYFPTYCRYAAIPDPTEALMILDGWCAARNTAAVPDKPVRLLIVGSSLDLNLPVLISSLEVKDRGGEPGDLYYTIECREYREIAIRTESELKADKTRTDLKGQAKTVTAKAKAGEPTREFLYKVAKTSLGKGSSWKAIYTLNKGKLQGSLTKGIKLVLK